MNNLTKSELDALLCKYGAREEYYKLELLDYYGSKKCDLHLKNGTINVYNDKVIKRYATLEFTEDDRVDYLNDKLRVCMGIRMNKALKWYSLGVFLMLTPIVEDGICYANCYDEVISVQQDKLDSPKLFLKGTNYGEVLRYFLISCGITKINIQATDLVLTADVVCDYTKNKAEWFNYFAEQINYTSLMTDANGWFVSKKYVEPSPLNVTNTYKDNEMSIILGTPRKKMDYYNIPNVITRIVSHPQLGMLSSTYTNTDPTSIFSIQRRHGKKIVDVDTVDNIANQIELDNLVRKLAFNAVQVEQEVTFETLNMPTHTVNDILDLRHKDLIGIFVEQSYSITLKAGAKMQHVCKRLVRLE